MRLLFFSILFFLPLQIIGKTNNNFNWTIVGAGPAGIAIIGVLLELGIPTDEILWIDPEFNVGRMGKYYYNIPGNTITKNFIFFINQCRVFNEFPSTSRDALIQHHNPNEECMLGLIVEPLRDITQYLRTKIRSIQTNVTLLEQLNTQEWKLQLENEAVVSQHVILATGSYPKSLHYPCDTTIPLDQALDKKTLATLVNPLDDTCAVIGGSHSAVLILKHLNELGIKRIINFYRQPLKYAYDMGDGTPPQANGLKGETGRWAYNILERNTPISIIRKKNTTESRDSWLPLCNKIIYAVGYERNEIPFADTRIRPEAYNSTTGEIASRLFGIGIAFPEETIQDDKKDSLIGLISFMLYAQRVAPEWINKLPSDTIEQLNELFTIVPL